MFQLNGQIFREEDELFTESRWTAVMMGQGITINGHNPVADTIATSKLATEVDEMVKSIRFLVQKMSLHGDYLKKYCPSSP